MRRLSATLLLAVLIIPASGHPDPTYARFPATLDDKYQGRYPDLFHSEFDRLRLLVNQSQLEASSQLGLLNYREGFRLPLQVRFEDELPPGVENALAFVQPAGSDGMVDHQIMVVNLKLLSQHRTDFDRLLYHEMTHAVLNDAALRPLPSWVQEGLAVYVSGEGPDRITQRLAGTHKFMAASLVQDLAVHSRTPDYAGDYLAFEYLHEKYSINAVQGFVREIAEGKSPETAIEDMTGVSFERFKQDLKAYIANVYKEKAPSDFS